MILPFFILRKAVQLNGLMSKFINPELNKMEKRVRVVKFQINSYERGKFSDYNKANFKKRMLT